MQKSAIRFSGWLVAAVAMTLAGTARTQVSSGPFQGREAIIPLNAGVTNGNITFSWPVMPGKWELLKQEPAITGDWQPLAPEDYKTNGTTVSVTLPMPKQKAYYRVGRALPFHRPKLPVNLPPIPPPPTNKPPKFKPHQ